jgi:hypothetical protein
MLERPAAERPPWDPPALSALFGVPIVPREDLEAGAWRVVDTDGHMIYSGTL